jgi:hypothetical protein
MVFVSCLALPHRHTNEELLQSEVVRQKMLVEEKTQDLEDRNLLLVKVRLSSSSSVVVFALRYVVEDITSHLASPCVSKHKKARNAINNLNEEMIVVKRELASMRKKEVAWQERGLLSLVLLESFSSLPRLACLCLLLASPFVFSLCNFQLDTIVFFVEQNMPCCFCRTKHASLCFVLVFVFVLVCLCQVLPLHILPWQNRNTLKPSTPSPQEG